MEDIRLNFNAINKFTIMKNGYKKPDHSDGTKVEMMICDLMSFRNCHDLYEGISPFG